MRIAIGCDPNARTAKEELMKFIKSKGLGELIDFGSEDTVYANVAIKVAEAVASGECDRGILICGTAVSYTHLNVSEYAFVNAYCNELDIGGGNRINRGVCGLFVYQQCLNEWKDAGEALDYDACLLYTSL